MTDGPDEEVIVIEDSPTPEVDNSDTTVEAPDAVVEASPTIIVEATPDAEVVSDSEIDRAVDVAERLTALEGVVGGLVNEVGEVRAELASAQFTAEMATDVAGQTAQRMEPVEDALAEVVAEDLGEDLDADPDTPPSTAGKHWFFKSYKELRGKS